MTTDRELLELAAKAAGIFSLDVLLQDPTPHYWNPLTDDGDALRLAVKLEMSAMFGECMQTVNGHVELCINADPYAATRRAIVRAAAEIERSKHA